MQKLLISALLVAAGSLGGCSYLPVPPDPIRYVTSPSEVALCRRLGSVGLARTDGVGPYRFSDLTTPVPAGLVPGSRLYAVPAGAEIVGPTLAVRVEVMRDAALTLGASDLLLSRRLYQDWSYVEGLAYRCPR